MMARSRTLHRWGRIQKRKTNFSEIIIFGLQRAAGPYRWANKTGHTQLSGRQSIRYCRM